MPWVAFTPVLVALGNGGQLLTVPDAAVNSTAIALEVSGSFPADWRFLGKMTVETVIDGQAGLLLPWADVLAVNHRQALQFANATPRRPYFVPVDWIRASTWRFYARQP